MLFKDHCAEYSSCVNKYLNLLHADNFEFNFADSFPKFTYKHIKFIGVPPDCVHLGTKSGQASVMLIKRVLQRMVSRTVNILFEYFI